MNSARWTEQELAEHLHRRGKGPLAAYQRSAGAPISREVKTDYKAQFEQQLSLVGIKFEREFVFARPRKFRADYVVSGTRVLVDFEGGLFAKNKIGHGNVGGILRDIEKTNVAQLSGHVLIRIAPNHVVSGQALKWVEQAIVLSELGLTNSDRTSPGI